MGFDPTSRYADVETAKLTTTDRNGRERVIAWKRRRVIPSYEDQPILAEHRVAAGDRLDNVTASYLGDPTQFWRLCDANVVLEPEELEVVGRVVRVALAQK
jgi:hypothetical protein